jgi:phthalate 4,5-cis-dihydrodiol dehydrogenase
VSTETSFNAYHQWLGIPLAEQPPETLRDFACERADLRPLPTGVMVYSDQEKHLEPLAQPAVQRAEVIDELYAAVMDGKAPVHDGEWALATMEACLAILQSAKEQREIPLRNQTALRT